jgi:hypothetical protein
MARKRRSGAGRPHNPYGQTAALSLRVSKRMREALDAAAAERGHTLSHEVVRRLEASLIADRTGAGGLPPHIRALADVVRRVVARVERDSNSEGAADRKFIADGYTAEAVRAAIDMVVDHFSASRDGAVVVPPHMRAKAVEAIARGLLPAKYKESWGSALAVGQRAAGIEISIIEGAESKDMPPSLGRLDPRYLDEQGYWQLKRDLKGRE